MLSYKSLICYIFYLFHDRKMISNINNKNMETIVVIYGNQKLKTGLGFLKLMCKHTETDQQNKLHLPFVACSQKVFPGWSQQDKRIWMRPTPGAAVVHSL